MAYLFGESPEEAQRRLEFPGPAPKYLICTFGSFYQIDTNPSSPRVLMWRGTGIMATKFGHNHKTQRSWEEIRVKEITLPTRLGEPMVFLTTSRCTTTTGLVYGREAILVIDRNMNPREVTLSETMEPPEGWSST